MTDTASGVAVVTGASGFVGGHLIRTLTEAGLSVRCLVRTSSDTKWIDTVGAERVYVSLDDPDALRAAVADAALVFHLAAVTSSARLEDYRRINVEGTRHVVDAVRDSAPHARLILCSSLAAAGPARDGSPVREHDAPHPVSPYGESKLDAERIVLASALDAVIVRPPAVYGPRDRDILAAFRLATYGLALRVAPADQRLSMIHVGDLARALLAAAMRGKRNAIYHVNDGAIHTWTSLAAAIGDAVGRPVRTIGVPRALVSATALLNVLAARITDTKPLLTLGRVAELSCADWTSDDSLARAELGFTPAIALRDGMRSTAQWYRANGWLRGRQNAR